MKTPSSSASSWARVARFHDPRVQNVGTMRERRTGGWPPASVVWTSLVLVVQWIFPTIGFVLLCVSRGYVDGGWFVILAPVVFVFGVLFFWRGRSTAMVEESSAEALHKFLRRGFVLCGVGTVTHFLLGGVPLLSDDVEIARFDSINSGLFGIPGRVTLYALPILALIGLATLRRGTGRVCIEIWALFAVSQILLGFKGAVLEVVILALLGMAVSGKRMRLSVVLAGGIAICGGLAYVSIAATRYLTLRGTSNPLQYLAYRATEGAIDSGYLLMQMANALGLKISNAAGHDLLALMAKYVLGQNEFTLGQYASSFTTGTPLLTTNFIVPVTVGGPVYLMFSGGVFIALFILILLGAVFARSVQRLGRPRSIRGLIISGAVVYAIRIFLLNGDGAYVVLNIGAVTVMLLALSVGNDPLRPRMPNAFGGLTTHRCARGGAVGRAPRRAENLIEHGAAGKAGVRSS